MKLEITVARSSGGIRSVMIASTADSPVPREVVDGIVAGDGFHAGRTVSLER